MSSNWRIFLDREIIKYKIFSTNSIRILLHLPEPQDYLSSIESGLKSLHEYVIESIRQKYYTGLNEDLTETSFNKHKSELFNSFKIEGDTKNKLEKLYLILREEYTSHNNYKSSAFAYDDAIRNANHRIWICQTWLPGTEKDGLEIIKRDVENIRLLLLSFKIDPEPNPPIYSPIYARISGRELKKEDAQLYSARSVKALVEKYLNQGVDIDNMIRFNYGHYPGWSAIIDDYVFCGFTPVDLESHGKDFLFHQYFIDSQEGEFWEEQFKLLWDVYSHPFEQEKKYNPKLNFD
jgi:hypothetical protein